MNRLLLIYFLLNITNLFSQSIENDNQVIREFEIDCSIRALEVENDSTCWFAGTNNKFGYTNDFGKTWKENVIKYDTFDLEFRSISVTTNSVFILSIGSPALLFKIDKKTLNYKLVYIETNEKAFFDSMQFWDDENGIAVGDPIENCMSVIITRDGGNNWNKISRNFIPIISTISCYYNTHTIFYWITNSNSIFIIPKLHRIEKSFFISFNINQLIIKCLFIYFK